MTNITQMIHCLIPASSKMPFTKAWWALLAILLFSGCLPRMNPEERANLDQYPQFAGTGAYELAMVEKGYIVTNMNDTLRGLIKLVPPIFRSVYDSCLPLLPEGKRGKTELVLIKRRNIRSIRVFAKTFGGRDYIDFFELDSIGLWRSIAQKNGIAVYDSFLGSYSGEFSDEMLVTKEQRIKMFSTYFRLFHPQHKLARFMNKRYNIHIRKKDFKSESVEEMFDEILDREEQYQKSIDHPK
jgi:hypothetical protein